MAGSATQSADVADVPTVLLGVLQLELQLNRLSLSTGGGISPAAAAPLVSFLMP